MNSISGLIALSMLIVVVLGWFAFTMIFLLRKKRVVTEEQKRDKASIIGIVLQMIGFGLVWSIRRPMFSAIGGSSTGLNAFLLIIEILFVVGSIWLVTKVVQTLGKQWSLTARLVKDHNLVIEGPYRVVRHPIYTGMMGMLFATGLATSYWWVIGLALSVFICGTIIRFRIEERLLRGQFGRVYDEYAVRVPALIPLTKGL